MASEAKLDNSTGGELLLGGRNTELQNTWGASSDEYEDTETLTHWAMQKETKRATVRHIQGSPPTKNTQRETMTPRNTDERYRRMNKDNKNYGALMVLEATRRRLRFNIARVGFQRRIRE